MNPTKASKYSLTVNAFSLDDVKRVEKALKENRSANSKLRLDQCFGPNPADGSYLAMFSSSSLGEQGYVPIWNSKVYLKLFFGLRKSIPGVRLVLRGEGMEQSPERGVRFTKIFDRVSAS